MKTTKKLKSRSKKTKPAKVQKSIPFENSTGIKNTSAYFTSIYRVLLKPKQFFSNSSSSDHLTRAFLFWMTMLTINLAFFALLYFWIAPDTMIEVFGKIPESVTDHSLPMLILFIIIGINLLLLANLLFLGAVSGTLQLSSLIWRAKASITGRFKIACYLAPLTTFVFLLLTDYGIYSVVILIGIAVFIIKVGEQQINGLSELKATFVSISAFFISVLVFLTLSFLTEKLLS